MNDINPFGNRRQCLRPGSPAFTERLKIGSEILTPNAGLNFFW